MYCPKCGAELNDGSVICNVCGEHFAMELQKGRFLAAKNKTLDILSDFFRSKLFLIFSIFTSILCGVSFISIFIGGGIEAILTFVLSILAVIACWSLYSSRTAPKAMNVRKIRWLFKGWRIFSKVLYILLIVCLVIIIICGVMIGFTWEAAEAELGEGELMATVADALYEEGLITYEEAVELAEFDISGWLICGIMIGIAVALTFFVAFYIVYGIMLKKAENYVMKLEGTCIFDKYTADNCPGKFMLVMGIIYAVISFGSSSYINFNIGEYELSTSLPNYLPTAIGAFLIFAGILFNKIHAAETANNGIIAHEEFELARVAQLTNAAISSAQAAPAVEETSAAEETPTVEETPAVEETPVIEGTPVIEETPAVEEAPNE